MFNRRGMFGVAAGAVAAVNEAKSSAVDNPFEYYNSKAGTSGTIGQTISPFDHAKSNIAHYREQLVMIERGEDPYGKENTFDYLRRLNVESLKSVSPSCKALIQIDRDKEVELARLKGKITAQLEYTVSKYIGLGGIYDAIKGCLK